MTILYKPVLIESAEQAETLPEGTIMFLPAGPYVWTARDPGGEFLDHYGRPWHYENTQGDEPFTALVPIEAEEEGTREFYGSNGTWHMTPPVDAYQSPHTRYVTPWEEV